jgi:DNA-binding NarL/FixJ family response regulator
MGHNRILVLEDEVIVAMDLQEILEKSGFEVMIAHNYLEAKAILVDWKPQLAICDIDLGLGKTGIDFALDAKSRVPSLEVIFLTAFGDRNHLDQTNESSPINYLVKPWNESQISISVEMAFQAIHKKSGEGHDFTPAEKRILELIAAQKKTKEIAEILFISEKTVKNHRYHISKKLGLSNENNSLLSWALKNM